MGNNKKVERDWGSVTFRLERPLLNHLETVCAKIGLEKSEICRRALTVGLRAFDDVRLPGSPGSSEVIERR